MNLDPIRCARPGCGRPYTEHGWWPDHAAPGCPGFLWVPPLVASHHPRWEGADTPPPRG